MNQKVLSSILKELNMKSLDALILQTQKEQDYPGSYSTYQLIKDKIKSSYHEKYSNEKPEIEINKDSLDIKLAFQGLEAPIILEPNDVKGSVIKLVDELDKYYSNLFKDQFTKIV